MTDAKAQVSVALDAMVSQGALAAAVAGRDGLPVLLRTWRPVQAETFCAMGAALLASGEAALQELSEARPALALVEAGDLRLIAAGIDDNNLLIVVAPSSMGKDKLLAGVNDLRAALRKALGG